MSLRNCTSYPKSDNTPDKRMNARPCKSQIGKWMRELVQCAKAVLMRSNFVTARFHYPRSVCRNLILGAAWFSSCSPPAPRRNGYHRKKTKLALPLAPCTGR